MRFHELVKYNPRKGVFEMKGPLAREAWHEKAHIEVANIGHLMQLAMFTYEAVIHTPYSLTFEDLTASDWYAV